MFLPTELREKAARWRAQADRALDEREKQSFIELAGAYDRLADQLAPDFGGDASDSAISPARRDGREDA